MNELLFFLQIFLLVAFILGAARLGKEALFTWICIQTLIANLFVLKQITLFGLDVTASDAFAVGSLLGLNLLQERHGQDEAKNASWNCFFFMLFFTLVSQVHLLYRPNSFDTAHNPFEILLSPTPRLFFASLSVFFIVQRFDIRIFTFMKNRFPGLSFPFRAGISLGISQFLDTFLFSFAGLYGIVSSVWEVIILSFIIKMIVVSCSTTLLRTVRS